MSLTGSRDHADDLAQRTALRGIEKAAQFTPGTSARAWLFTMARRLWLNELRANAVRNGMGIIPAEDADLADSRPSAETNIFAAEVFTAISRLSPPQRETVMLVYVEGLKYREAAEVMDVPVGTVMSRLAAARKRLSGALGEEID